MRKKDVIIGLGGTENKMQPSIIPALVGNEIRPLIPTTLEKELMKAEQIIGTAIVSMSALEATKLNLHTPRYYINKAIALLRSTATKGE